MNHKDKIYKEYLSSEIHESELIIKLDSIQKKSIKNDGVIYTPWQVVQKMVSIANPSRDTNIVEPSCGHGIFLIALLYYMNEKHGLEGEELHSWFKEKVVGIEISENTVAELKKILSIYFLKHFKILIKPSEFSNIHCHDGLTFDDGRHFDLCIGNPPYITAKNIELKYLKFLKDTYKSCKKGTIDIYFAFIEKYSTSADSVVFITPNNFLTSNAGLVLKNVLLDKLTFLVDFKEKKIFKDASVYTCVFKTDIDKSSTKIVYGNDLDKTEIRDKSEIFHKLDAGTNGEIDTVLSEVATLCDKVYLVRKGDDGKFYAIHNSQSYEIENGIIVPYLKLTKIKSKEDVLNTSYMIYPYKDDKRIITEVELKEYFPLAYKYLLTVKERLSQRDKGKTSKYEKWYSYGRKQGLYHINEKTIIIIPRIIGGECIPRKIDITNLLNTFGKIVFTSGFVIPQNDKNKEVCDSILGQKFINFVRKNGRALPGKNENYYSITAKQIRRFKT